MVVGGEHEHARRAFAAVMRLVAVMPSVRGMRMSINTTFGLQPSGRAIAVAPSVASPTISMSGCVLSRVADARADQRLVVKRCAAS